MLVADIHHGPPSGSKAGGAALPLLNGFVDGVNALPPEQRPDLVVDLGDRINDLDRERDLERLSEVAAVFGRLEVARVHLFGNHDVVHLDAEDGARVLGGTTVSHSLEFGDWQLVFWRARAGLEASGFRFDPEDLAWLEATLGASRKTSVIFTHAPFSGASMLGNHYFEAYPEYAGYADAGRARGIVARHDVGLCVAGHVHWNTLSTVDGTHHVTVQSLTETFTTAPHPAGAHALLTLEPGRATLEVFGRDPIRLELPLKPAGHRWLPPQERRA